VGYGLDERPYLHFTTLGIGFRNNVNVFDIYVVFIDFGFTIHVFLAVRIFSEYGTDVHPRITYLMKLEELNKLNNLFYFIPRHSHVVYKYTNESLDIGQTSMRFSIGISCVEAPVVIRSYQLDVKARLVFADDIYCEITLVPHCSNCSMTMRIKPLVFEVQRFIYS